VREQQGESAGGAGGGKQPPLAGIRLRLLVLILATQAVMVWWVANSEIAVGIYLICYSLMMPTALYLLLVRLLRRWLPFEDRELLLGYIVLTATIPIIGFGGVRFLATGMGFLSYFAETQPQWVKYLPVLGQLPVLHDAAAARALYLGEAAVPWQAWAVPIAFWSAYLLLLSAIWLGLAGVLRRIWIHQERLTFPVAMLPLQMADPRQDIFRRPLFWLGFGIPAVLQSLLAINHLVPAVPAFQMKGYNIIPLIFQSPPWNAIPDFYVGFYPMAVGLAYFVPSSVSFSCWFLTVAAKLSYVVSAFFGVEAVSTISRFPYTQQQGVGAWIAFTGLILWGGRKGWRTALQSVPEDERRLVSRLWLLAGAGALLCALMMMALGLPPLVALGVIGIYVAYVLSGARVRAEAGSIWTFAPLLTPYRAVNAMIGTQAVGTRTLAAGGYFDLVHVDVRAMSLPYLMEGLDIAEKIGIPWRTVLVWVAIGLVTALGLGWWRTLAELYSLGAATAKTNIYPLVKVQIDFADMERLSAGTTAWDRSGVVAMVFGAAFTLFLAWSRRAGILGLHPVGYVLCNTLTMNAFVVPFLIAWSAKVLILRLGGDKVYRKSVPFFVGVILGDIVTQATWALAGWLFGIPVYQFLT